MEPLLASLLALDGKVSEEVTDLRCQVLTGAMHAVSSWWVKGPLFVAVALIADVVAVRAARRWVPLAMFATLASVLVASLASTWAKGVFDRARPPLGDVGISAIAALPSSASFPSGHATTAFAAAAALAVMRPSLRWWAFGVAAAVAFSRVYLGVHYASDVLAGAMLGSATGAALALLALRIGKIAPSPAV